MRLLLDFVLVLVARIGKAEVPPPHTVGLPEESSTVAIVLKMAAHYVKRALEAARLEGARRCQLLAHRVDFEHVPSVGGPAVCAFALGVDLGRDRLGEDIDVLTMAEANGQKWGEELARAELRWSYQVAFRPALNGGADEVGVAPSFQELAMSR